MLDDEIRFESGGDMLDNVLDFARGLDACQMRRATEVMKALTIHELRGPDVEPGSCPLRRALRPRTPRRQGPRVKAERQVP